MLGKAAVLVATEVDVGKVDFEEKEGRQVAELEFLLVVAHRETGEFFRYDQGVNMRLLPETRERLSKLWYPIVRDFELKAGDYQAKIVIRDKKSGRVGTVMHEFVVPSLEAFRVSTPIISDSRLAGGDASAAPRLSVLARRQFVSGSSLFCSVEVYGAKRDPKTGLPIVWQGYEVRRSDGSVLTSMAPSVIRPTSIGAVNRMFGFTLQDASPGTYEVFQTFRDEVDGHTLERRDSFEVLPPGALPLPAAPVAGPAPPAAEPKGDGAQ
jgi:hypothetical protein